MKTNNLRTFTFFIIIILVASVRADGAGSAETAGIQNTEARLVWTRFWLTPDTFIDSPRGCSEHQLATIAEMTVFCNSPPPSRCFFFFCQHKK